MLSPIQVATELETFKRAHNGGQIITDAVKTIREQNEELAHYRDMEARFGAMLRFIKKHMGRRMEIYARRKKCKRTASAYGVAEIKYVLPTGAARNEYDAMVRDCEAFVANAGVYGSL